MFEHPSGAWFGVVEGVQVRLMPVGNSFELFKYSRVQGWLFAGFFVDVPAAEKFLRG